MSRCGLRYDGDRRRRNSLVSLLIALTATISCFVNISAAESDSSPTAVLYQPSELLDGAVLKRRESDAVEVGSLVPSSDRALRNSYVRFGRTSGRALSPDEILSYMAAASAEADRKRAKHYVRYGRDGRHYVRFGRSFPSTLAVDDEEAEVENAFDKRSPDRTYVRFGRSVADDVSSANADSVVSRWKRASGNSGKQYIRYGRNNALGVNDKSRVARGGGQTQAAAKHYVRFGRTSSGSAPDNVDDLRLNLEPEEEEKEKRSGSGGASKHYVRFGRTPEVTTTDALKPDFEGKRSTHYVRFGRSGDLELPVEGDKVDATSDDKRSTNYVRFG